MRMPGRWWWMVVCLGAGAWPVAAAPLRVLFVGNSLTGGHNVPALVESMARGQGVEIECLAVAQNDFSLEDHWRHVARRRLERIRPDVLVLQQGASTRAASRAHLRQWAAAWVDEARRVGARPALFLVWPVRGQPDGFALVSRSYREAATAAGAAVLPAGEAWERVLRANPAAALYADDGLHATPAGAFLAAMVIARGVAGVDPGRVPAKVNRVTVSADQLALFRGVVGAMDAESAPR